MCEILIITQQILAPFRGSPIGLQTSKISSLKHFCKINNNNNNNKLF
jgi:hypothetical protein